MHHHRSFALKCMNVFNIPCKGVITHTGCVVLGELAERGNCLQWKELHGKASITRQRQSETTLKHITYGA